MDIKLKKSLLICLLYLGQHFSGQAVGTPYVPYTPDFTINRCTAPGSTIGWLARNIPANGADIAAKQQIEVIVTSPGPYNFTTPVVNGVTFSTSGTFAAPGTYTLDLIATGNPTNYTVNNNTYSYTVRSTTATNAGTCNFGRKVYVADQGYYNDNAGAGNHRFIYKVITGPSGREWLQTNLGSLYNKVGNVDFDPEMYAQGPNDFRAFGSLFQLGRASDGHELTNWTSSTTATFEMGTTTNNTINPTATNSGLFITSSVGDQDSNTGDLTKQLDEVLREYVVGPNQPCPADFTVAKVSADDSSGSTNFFEEEGIPYNGTATPALNSPLKLIAPNMYRNSANGQLTSLPYRLIRSNMVALYPTWVANAPEFVIGGGNLIETANNARQDRRFFLNNNDNRGPRDAYPVRCSKY